MSSLIAAAQDCARRGWHVFPLHGIVNGRCTCGRRGCSSPGKHPLVRRGLHEATCDPHVIKEWWRRWRCANIAIATGRRSGIVVIDIDLPLAIQSLPAVVHKLARTLAALTGGGGLHLLLRAPGDRSLHNHTSSLPGIDQDLPGIDLRAQGGYIVAPPSAHISGNHYGWLDLAVPVAPAPDWLREPPRQERPPLPPAAPHFTGDGSAYGLAAMRRGLKELRNAQEGTRNHTLNRVAYRLAQLIADGHLRDSIVRRALSETSLAIGLTPRETYLTIDSAFRAASS